MQEHKFKVRERSWDRADGMGELEGDYKNGRSRRKPFGNLHSDPLIRKHKKDFEGR